MKNFNSRILTALLLSALPFWNISETSQAKDSGERVFYVSLVKKNSVNRFLNRLSTPSAHLVVTRAPVANAIAAKSLSVSGDARLVLAELHDGKTLGLPGERLRLENIAVLEVPVGVDAHDIVGLKSYAEEIAGVETETPAPQNLSQKQDLITQNVSTLTIDQSYLEEKLGQFSGAQVATIAGKPVTIKERGSKEGKDNARAFLKQEYEALGFKVTMESYGSVFSSGVNFVAEKAGTILNEVLVLSSHMDSVGNAGADDNGTGTIGALAIAAALKDTPLRYTLRIVAFDQEEDGLLGSAAYTKSLKAAGATSQIIGAVNLEMTGYDADNDGAFHVIDCNEGHSADLSAALMKVVNRDPLRLKRVAACTNRSDHASFWKYNIPSVVISQNFFGGDDNPCYHKSCDKVDRVKFDYMTRITTAVGRAVAEIVSEP